MANREHGRCRMCSILWGMTSSSSYVRTNERGLNKPQDFGRKLNIYMNHVGRSATRSARQVRIGLFPK